MKNLLHILFCLALASPLTAAADQRVEAGDGENAVGFEFDGEYRFQGTALSDFDVDAEGHSMGQSAWADQRLRAGFHLTYRRLRVGTEWDLFTGQLFGDTWDVPCELDERRRHVNSVVGDGSFLPREAALSLSWPHVQMQVGLTTSHWGLGMMANDGAHDPMFGRADFGDRVVRVRITGKPLYNDARAPGGKYLMVTAAFDWVVSDDMARFSQQQLAFQGIASLLYADPQARQLGIYMVFRSQKEQDTGRETRAFALDGFGQLPLALGSTGWGLRGAAEGALIVGMTDRAPTYNRPGGTGVVSGGAAGVITVHEPNERLQFHLRGGVASGDPEPDDGVTRDFTFDRDFDVGMVLFDQLMGGVEGATHALLTDPTRSPPPDGVDAVVTEGAFRRAIFAQPVVQATPWPWLDVRLGVLMATGSVDVAQPYYSFRAGGVPRNHADMEPQGRYLGTEFDWAVRIGGAIKPKLESSPRAAFILQGGHLRTGSALYGCCPCSIHMVQMTGRFRW